MICEIRNIAFCTQKYIWIKNCLIELKKKQKNHENKLKAIKAATKY